MRKVFTAVFSLLWVVFVSTSAKMQLKPMEINPEMLNKVLTRLGVAGQWRFKFKKKKKKKKKGIYIYW